MSNPLLFSAAEIRNRCLCFATQRAARTLARRFDRAFAALGITNHQFSLMTALSAPQPPQLSQLAPFLAMDRTTLTAALKALERRGLVVIAVDASDRRIRRPQLTEAGRAAVAAALPIWCAEHDRLDAELTEIQPEMLRQMLAAVATVPDTRGEPDEQSRTQ